MTKEIIKLFYELCLKAKYKWEEAYGTNELENDLLTILVFVKENKKCMNDFVNGFINIVNDYSIGPLEIVIFCMRELQWEEIKEAAMERQSHQDDPRIKSAMQDVLDVYNPKWENSDLYQYYSRNSDN